MSAFMDDLTVGVVLLAGFGYATYSLGPRSLRGALLKVLAALLRRLPAGFGLGAAERLTVGKGGACGGCDNCGSNTSPSGASPSGKSAASQSGAAEVRVPVSKIGKRH